MLVHGHAFALNRGTVEHVDVELDSRSGLPGLCVIGLGGGAARDARERVQAAVLNSGFIFPRRRLTANLAPPATSTRDSPEFDLVLACCVLAAQELVDAGGLRASDCSRSSGWAEIFERAGPAPMSRRLPPAPASPGWSSRARTCARRARRAAFRSPACAVSARWRNCSPPAPPAVPRAAPLLAGADPRSPARVR